MVRAFLEAGFEYFVAPLIPFLIVIAIIIGIIAIVSIQHGGGTEDEKSSKIAKALVIITIFVISAIILLETFSVIALFVVLLIAFGVASSY